MHRKITPQESRSGIVSGRVLLVLVVSFGCAAVALGLVWLFFLAP